MFFVKFYLQNSLLEVCFKVYQCFAGDWFGGKREGRGEEVSQYGQYKGGWKGDQKHGYGEERTLVGTIFEGNWEKGRKNGRGVRKMIFGAVDEQVHFPIV